MKLVNKRIYYFKGLILLLLIGLSSLACVYNLSLSEAEEKSSLMNNAQESTEADKKHKKKVHKKTRTTSKLTTNIASKADNFTSLKNQTYLHMNQTYSKQDLATFKNNNRRWDYKMTDKQLDDIFKTMHVSKDYKTIHDDRAYMEIFLNSFYGCDKDDDNVLNYAEFKSCMTADSYLSVIRPPPQMYAAHQNYTDAGIFYDQLFRILDNQDTGFVNFYNYMELRLMIFSWKKCSVVAPFIEETSWECAIEVVSGLKTASRTTLRNTFYMCLELANASGIRNIDFISFMMFASSARLYGKINGKMDHDINSKFFYNT
jgi:hypothetical protein